MGIFKKKQPREVKEDDSLLVKLWYTPRTHALMVLGIYAIFFIIIILIANIVDTNKTSVKSIKGENLKDNFASFDSHTINYNFVISSEDNVYYFSGKNMDDNNVYGTLLHDGIVKNVVISENNCTVENDFEDSCPTVINYNYFDYNNIYNLIKDVSTQAFDTTKDYIFNVDNNTKIKLYTSGKIIKKIEINDNDNMYSLSYTIGELINNNNLENNE